MTLGVFLGHAWQAANDKGASWGGSFKSEGTTHGALSIVRCP
jgi:hypothetical protein